MGRRRQRRRRLASATSSSAGAIKINDASSLKKRKTNDASAMLLYQSPTGITVFSFDGGYLNDPVKDFWACLPPLSLKLSIKYEKVPTPINLVNEDIDSFLDTKLTELCGSEKKLVVGSAEYERIIGEKLGINCLYVEVPDCEVIIRSLKNPMLSVKINDALALLLYQAPSGIAIFCFDGGHLNNSVEDFWACLPQLSLIVFIKKKVMPNPIDPATEDMDGRLVKTLRKLCHSGRKLVVGNAEYKRIIETKLGIKHCEVIICCMNKPKCPLLPEQQSEPTKDLELFLHQHGFDVMHKMVDVTSVKEAAYLLHDTELCENEYLKFFRLLLKDFMVTSEIDTKSWVLIHFATALKMICHPGASYEVYRPVKLFSSGDVRKIEAHAPGYRRSFSRIDVLSVYEDVVSLDSKKCVLMFKLDIRVQKAKRVLENADVRLSKYHSPEKLYRSTGSKVGKEASSNVDGRLNSIAQDNCIEVNLVNHSDLDFSCEWQEQNVEQILTIPEINSSMGKPNRHCDEENCNKENDPRQQVMSNQTTSAGGQHYLVLDDDIPATKIVTRSRLDSRPSKQEEIPGTISGRLMDLVAMEMECEEMEAKFKNLVLA